jgi:hypothetical protein
MRKPKWEQEMEDYVNGMTEEEVREFLEDTKYEFYKNVKTSFLGLKGLDTPNDHPAGFVWPSDDQSLASSIWTQSNDVGLCSDSSKTFVTCTVNVSFAQASIEMLAPWVSSKKTAVRSTPFSRDVEFQEMLSKLALVRERSDIRNISERDKGTQYDLAA